MSPTTDATPLPHNEADLRNEALQIAATQPPVVLRTQAQAGRPETHRDTWDQITIAFILAFVFRTFVAEAFIIPTGSMAETLFGRHKDLHCSECNTRFQIGASGEVDRENGNYLAGSRLHYGFCPNCRYAMDLEDELPFKGDRIIVNKFPYDWQEPNRWDVSVFKYPDDPKINYIKRLVGLPGETISIIGGDLYRQTTELAPLEILRKPPAVQQELQMLVYDHAHPAQRLLAAGFPERWRTALANDWRRTDPVGWSANPQARTFEVNLPAQGAQTPRWIRYQHLVPENSDWEAVNQGQAVSATQQPIMIADYCAYNSGITSNSPSGSAESLLGNSWVGDLTVHAQLDVIEPRGDVTFELVEGRRRYHCAIDLATGRCTLSYQDQQYRRSQTDPLEDVAIAEAETVIKAPGQYEISFANVDDRLLVWVNNKLVPLILNGQQVDGSYTLPPVIADRMPTTDDLSPVGIAARGAAVRVGQLRITRDLYYTDNYDSSSNSYARQNLQKPDQYAQQNSQNRNQTFALSADEFLMLGDNSSASQDSRAWNSNVIHPHAVNRRLLVGKAFVVYWPHGVPVGNEGRGYAPKFGPLKNLLYESQRKDDAIDDYQANSLLFYPQFGRMKWIR